MDRICITHVEDEKCIQNFGSKLEPRREEITLVSRRRWETDIKVIFEEVWTKFI
jgi:hypothetical protein